MSNHKQQKVAHVCVCNLFWGEGGGGGGIKFRNFVITFSGLEVSPLRGYTIFISKGTFSDHESAANGSEELAGKKRKI